MMRNKVRDFFYINTEVHVPFVLGSKGGVSFDAPGITKRQVKA